MLWSKPGLGLRPGPSQTKTYCLHQARTSYLPQEILWGYRFNNLVSYARKQVRGGDSMWVVIPSACRVFMPLTVQVLTILSRTTPLDFLHVNFISGTLRKRYPIQIFHELHLPHQASSVVCPSLSTDELPKAGLHSRKTSRVSGNHLPPPANMYWAQNRQEDGHLHQHQDSLGQEDESVELKTA